MLFKTASHDTYNVPQLLKPKIFLKEQKYSQQYLSPVAFKFCLQTQSLQYFIVPSRSDRRHSWGTRNVPNSRFVSPSPRCNIDVKLTKTMWCSGSLDPRQRCLFDWFETIIILWPTIETILRVLQNGWLISKYIPLWVSFMGVKNKSLNKKWIPYSDICLLGIEPRMLQSCFWSSDISIESLK